MKTLSRTVPKMQNLCLSLLKAIRELIHTFTTSFLRKNKVIVHSLCYGQDLQGELFIFCNNKEIDIPRIKGIFIKNIFLFFK